MPKRFQEKKYFEIHAKLNSIKFNRSFIFFFSLSLLSHCRVFGTRRCSRCMASISSTELVMRARHLVFHVRCFSCAVCNALLTKGDQFGMRESAVYCRLHYDIVLESPTTASTPLSMNYQYSQYSSSPNGQTSPAHSDNVAMKLGPSGGYYGTAAHSMTGLPQAPRQKGRPRKRKPKDIEAMTANLGEFKHKINNPKNSEIRTIKNKPQMFCVRFSMQINFWIKRKHLYS